MEKNHIKKKIIEEGLKTIVNLKLQEAKILLLEYFLILIITLPGFSI